MPKKPKQFLAAVDEYHNAVLLSEKRPLLGENVITFAMIFYGSSNVVNSIVGIPIKDRIALLTLAVDKSIVRSPI